MPLSRSSSSVYLRLCILSAFGAFTVNTAIAATPISTVDTIVDGVNEQTLPQAELEKIVVTATRTPTKARNVIAQTRVIDSKELQRFQGQTVSDVLRHQAGISYYDNGGMGSLSKIYMRGYEGKQILVIIDGMRYGSVSTGSATIGLLPADQIERIEILYGASGSSVYGADAMGGVIQIFTKGGNVQQNNFAITAGVGSNNQYTYGGSAQLTNGNGSALSLAASHNKTDGINATLPTAYGYNQDDDGFESDNVSIALNHRINEQWSAGASALYSQSTTEFDNGDSTDDSIDQENGAAQVFVDWRYNPNASVKLQYGHSIDKLDNKFGDDFNTKQDQINLIGQHQLPVGQGIYGLEYLNQSLDSTVYQADDLDVSSAFLGYVLANTQFDAQANLRFDDNSQFGDQTTYNLGAAYRLNPNIRIGATYAKGFRAPNFNELYYPNSGNINLIAETSDNYEAFIEYDTLLQSTRLTGYQNKVDDLINFSALYDAEGQYVGGSYENIEQSKIKGITLTSDWVMGNYLLGGSYDYQQAQDDSGSINDGNFLAIRPEHKGLVYAGYRLPSLDIRAEYQYVGDYYSGSANVESQLVESYGLVNISGNYQLTDNLTMTARLNNVTNKKYVTLPGYNTDGTNFFTSLTYNWY